MMSQLGQRMLMLVAVACALFVTWREGYMAGYNHRVSDLKAIGAEVGTTETADEAEPEYRLARRSES